MSAQKCSSPRTATASLLYWLLVVCGLAGITALRIDTPREVLPLWLGSLGGLALGQMIAWLRLRAWLITVIVVACLWCSPVVFAIVFQVFGTYGSFLETFVLTFLPAAICGYLSLSERGGLAAFWYPAVLWMVVILDRPAGPGAPRSAEPVPPRGDIIRRGRGLGLLFLDPPGADHA